MKPYWPLMCFLVCGPLLADISDEKIFSMTLEELLQVPITGSTLTEESLLSVPSAVTVYSHQEIQRLGVDYLDELANLVPGFQSYRSAQSPLQNPISSRGRLISLEASELLVMIDGQRVDGPRSNGITVPLPKISLDYIERVEFIRGPGSAIYGSNAMMGIINIISRKNVNSIQLAAGSFNSKKLNLLFSHESGDFQFDGFLQSQQDDGEDYLLADTFSDNQIETDDPRKIDDIILKINYQKTNLNIQQHQFESENFYELDGISNGFNERNGSISSIALKQDFTWQKVDSWLQVDYRETNIKLAGQLTPIGELTSVSDPSSSDALYVVAHFEGYAETHVQWHNSFSLSAWPASNIQFGFEYRYVDAPGTVAKNNFDIEDLATANFPIDYYGELLATTLIQEKSDRNITGQYFQLQHEITKRSQLTFGLRHDDFNNLGSRLTPRLGLVHSINDQHQIKLLYGEAYRVPSESELFLKNNPVLLGNPDLKAESVQTVDLIWMGHWFNRAITLGYFENHFTDAIIQTPSELGIPRFENVNQDPSKGIELEYSEQINSAVLIKATYTHITDKPDINFREAAQLGSLTVNFQHSEYNANLVATWHDERELAATDAQSQRIKLASNWLWFAKFSIQHNQQLQSFLQVKNPTDKQYSSPSLGAALTDGVASRGREILLGINWKY